ncbi:MAG: phosphatase PAP2 family protein [Streptosporangiales bacterium]|nr:phosphatase PAP2 family protein [Streptosporangiales bacterium]
MPVSDSDLAVDDRQVEEPVDAAPAPPALRRVLGMLTSLPALVGAFVGFTLLAIGPLKQLDLALNQPWSAFFFTKYRWLFQDVIDHMASQWVAVPILGAVALLIAVLRRSFRPIAIVLGVELGWYGVVGTLKLLFSRPAPFSDDPSFFSGSLLTNGWQGISYPSGHASEAVLLYGAIVYLLLRYTSLPRYLIVLSGVGVAAITVATVLNSFYLGWHWATDLVGGALAGAMLLRAVVVADKVITVRVRRTDAGRVKVEIPPLIGVKRELRGSEDLPRATSSSGANR